MEELLNTSRTHPTSPSLPNRPGPPLTPDPSQMTSHQAEAYVSTKASTINNLKPICMFPFTPKLTHHSLTHLSKKNERSNEC